MSEKTTKLTLAHPLSAAQAERLGLAAKDLAPGDSVTVPLNVGRAIIESAYAAGVDPRDRDAVKAALGGVNPQTVDSAVGVEPTEGSTGASASSRRSKS